MIWKILIVVSLLVDVATIFYVRQMMEFFAERLSDTEAKAILAWDHIRSRLK